MQPGTTATMPILTIVPVGDRFTVESDQYIPDPKFRNVQICLMLTSKEALAKSGDTWATRKGAEAAAARYFRQAKACAASPDVDRLVQALRNPNVRLITSSGFRLDALGLHHPDGTIESIEAVAK